MRELTVSEIHMCKDRPDELGSAAHSSREDAYKPISACQ